MRLVQQQETCSAFLFLSSLPRYVEVYWQAQSFAPWAPWSRVPSPLIGICFNARSNILKLKLLKWLKKIIRVLVIDQKGKPETFWEEKIGMPNIQVGVQSGMSISKCTHPISKYTPPKYTYITSLPWNIWDISTLIFFPSLLSRSLKTLIILPSLNLSKTLYNK